MVFKKITVEDKIFQFVTSLLRIRIPEYHQSTTPEEEGTTVRCIYPDVNTSIDITMITVILGGRASNGSRPRFSKARFGILRCCL